MTSDRELMQQALDALESMSGDEFLCNAAHHNKKDMHKIGDSCPVAARYKATRETLRARLAQPEREIESDRDHVEDDGCPTEKAVLQRFWREHQKQEPVAWMYNSMGDTRFAKTLDTPGMHRDESVPLYTAPPQREWQGLTDEEIIKLQHLIDWTAHWSTKKFARAIEAKLKEKNSA